MARPRHELEVRRRDPTLSRVRDTHGPDRLVRVLDSVRRRDPVLDVFEVHQVRRIRVPVPRGRVPVGDEHHRREPGADRQLQPGVPVRAPCRVVVHASIVALESSRPVCGMERHEVSLVGPSHPRSEAEDLHLRGRQRKRFDELFAAFAYAVLFGVIEPDRSSTSETFSPHPAGQRRVRPPVHEPPRRSRSNVDRDLPRGTAGSDSDRTRPRRYAIFGIVFHPAGAAFSRTK